MLFYIRASLVRFRWRVWIDSRQGFQLESFGILRILLPCFIEYCGRKIIFFITFLSLKTSLNTVQSLQSHQGWKKTSFDCITFCSLTREKASSHAISLASQTFLKYPSQRGPRSVWPQPNLFSGEWKHPQVRALPKLQFTETASRGQH